MAPERYGNSLRASAGEFVLLRAELQALINAGVLVRLWASGIAPDSKEWRRLVQV